MLNEAVVEYELSDEDGDKLKALARRTFAEDAFQRIARADVVHREVPFCVRMDNYLLEGQIDCVFLEDGDWIVVDYKTDPIPATGAEALITACPWCQRNFKDAIEEGGPAIEILDIMELIEKAV